MTNQPNQVAEVIDTLTSQIKLLTERYVLCRVDLDTANTEVDKAKAEALTKLTEIIERCMWKGE